MALSQFDIANKKQGNSAIVVTNIASAYAMKNMKPESMVQLDKASTLEGNDDVKKGMNGVRGALEIKAGKYNEAGKKNFIFFHSPAG